MKEFTSKENADNIGNPEKLGNIKNQKIKETNPNGYETIGNNIVQLADILSLIQFTKSESSKS